jgi:O-antigen/teichoic acid export membrane protein
MPQSVAKNTLYLTAASVGQKILAFVYFLFLARVMGAEQTGGYFLALSITTIFSTITDFGITPVVIRDVAKHPDEAAALVRRALWFKIPLMALGAAGALGAVWLLGYDQTVRELVALASLVMLADAVSLLFYGVLRGHHILQFESLGIFVGQSFTLLFGGVVLLLDPSLHLLVLALLIGSVFNMLFSARQAVGILGARILIPNWDRRTSVGLLKAAVPFALAGIFVKVYSYVDSVFISKMIDTAAVGVYSVAYKFTYSFQFLPMAFVAALYPGLSALVGKDSEQLRRLFDDAMWYVMLLATPITFGLWAVAPDAVALAGKGYGEAAAVLQVLVFVLIPIFLDFPVGSLLNAADRQGTKTAIMGVTMVLNVILNALLIPRLGVLGAAWAGVGSFYFLFVASLWFVPRIIPGYSLRRLMRTTAPIVLSGLVMGMLAYALRPVVGFVLVIPVAAVAYAAMLLITRSVRMTHLRQAFCLVRRKQAYEDTVVHD